MTMLNTLSNLGGQWPGTFVLAFKVRECSACPSNANRGHSICLNVDQLISRLSHQPGWHSTDRVITRPVLVAYIKV